MKITHIRQTDPTGVDRWLPKSRGVTLVVYDVGDGTADYHFAIQNPTDQYNKKEGVRIANNTTAINAKWEYGKSDAWQFLNAVLEEFDTHSDTLSRPMNPEDPLLHHIKRAAIAYNAVLDVVIKDEWTTLHFYHDKIPHLHPSLVMTLLSLNNG